MAGPSGGAATDATSPSPVGAARPATSVFGGRPRPTPASARIGYGAHPTRGRAGGCRAMRPLRLARCPGRARATPGGDT
eukprot:10781298-Lingulodinium_polyedra.AAC.1